MPSGETKKKRVKPVPAADAKRAPRWLRPLLLQVVLAATLACVPIACLLGWKQWVVAASPYFDVPFQAIDCTPPPMMAKSTFLTQVRQLAAMPERLNMLQRDVARDLAAAFARHPWIARVVRVELRAQREIVVELEFRQPMLEVRQTLGSASSLLVASDGVYIPREEFTKPLLVLVLPTTSMQRPGRLASDARVIAAARLASSLRAYERVFDFRSIECDGKDLIAITQAGSRVLWGRAPQDESDAEPLADLKLRRLLDYCTSHGNLDKPDGRYVHDLRPKGQAEHRPMAVHANQP